MTYMFMIISIFSVLVFGYLEIPSQQIDKMKLKNGNFSETTSSFTQSSKATLARRYVDFSDNSQKKDIETIETALIRSCRSVSTIAHDNGCSGWDKASYVWSFVGTSGTIGSLDSTSTGTSSLSFSCSTQDDFGRGLFQQSLPSRFVISKGYLYDLTSLDDENSDPCGYINLVRL